MNTKHVGDVSESMIITRVIQRGYTVSIPFGDNDPYDIVVDADDRLFRVQVKTGWMEDSCVRFKTASTTESGETFSRDYTSETVDAFCVRCRGSNECYRVPITDVGLKNTYLRTEEAEIIHPNINYAKEYKFDENPPRLTVSARDC